MPVPCTSALSVSEQREDIKEEVEVEEALIRCKAQRKSHHPLAVPPKIEFLLCCFISFDALRVRRALVESANFSFGCSTLTVSLLSAVAVVCYQQS